jgi:hypothetical protein
MTDHQQQYDAATREWIRIWDALIAKKEALEAVLAEVRSDRQREHDLRVKFIGYTEALDARVCKLEAALREIALYGKSNDVDCAAMARSALSDTAEP